MLGLTQKQPLLTKAGLAATGFFFLGEVFSALVITETSLPKNDTGACFVRT